MLKAAWEPCIKLCGGDGGVPILSVFFYALGVDAGVDGGVMMGWKLIDVVRKDPDGE